MNHEEMKMNEPDGLDARIEVVSGSHAELTQVEREGSSFQVFCHQPPGVVGAEVVRYGHHFGDGRVAQHGKPPHATQHLRVTGCRKTFIAPIH